jgi:stage III sporulation protein AG
MFSFWKTEGEGAHGGRIWILLLLGALGVGLLLFGKMWEGQNTSPAEDAVRSTEEEMRAYQTYLEERIKVLCESVSGVSDATVIVSLSGGFGSVYATEWHNDNEAYVILGSGANAEALLLSHSAPEIVGIGVVCRGGGNDVLRRELISLISAGFDIPSNRIYVTEARK